MKYRRRIYYSTEQRAEIWDRWQRGESMRSTLSKSAIEILALGFPSLVCRNTQ